MFKMGLCYMYVSENMAGLDCWRESWLFGRLSRINYWRQYVKQLSFTRKHLSTMLSAGALCSCRRLQSLANRSAALVAQHEIIRLTLNEFDACIVQGA